MFQILFVEMSQCPAVLAPIMNAGHLSKNKTAKVNTGNILYREDIEMQKHRQNDYTQIYISEKYRKDKEIDIADAGPSTNTNTVV